MRSSTNLAQGKHKKKRPTGDPSSLLATRPGLKPETYKLTVPLAIFFLFFKLLNRHYGAKNSERGTKNTNNQN